MRRGRRKSQFDGDPAIGRRGKDGARAARLLAHPYLVIGRALRNRIRVEDPLKLLPPPGEYDAHINGKPARLTVDAAQELITRDILPEGRVVITF